MISMMFLVKAYIKLKQTDLSNLSSTAKDLCHLINEYGKTHNLKNEIKLYLNYDQLQEFATGTCGIFQLYFYKNLFDPLADSQIIHDEKLTETTISSTLNEIFTQSTEENENKINEFAVEYNIDYESSNPVQILTVFIYSKLLTLDSF